MRTKQVEPRLTLAELQRRMASEAALQATRPEEDLHGLTITGDQEMEVIRLGVREDLANRMEYWMPDRTAGEQIIDTDITRRILRRIAARRLSLEKQQAGFWGKIFMFGRGSVHNLSGFFVGEEADEIGTRVREIFGEGQTIEQQRIIIAQQLWAPLNAAQRLAIQNELVAAGLAFPPPPPFAPGVNLQVQQLAQATPAQLERVRRHAMAGGVHVFAPGPRPRFFPGTRIIPPATLLDELIELREGQAESRSRRLSVTINDPQKLQGFLDTIRTSNPDIYERITKDILEENELNDLENNPKAMALVQHLEYALRTRGQLQPSQDLQLLQDLRDIYEDIPTHEDETKPGKEPSNEKRQLEIVKHQIHTFETVQKELNKAYDDARSLGAQWYDTNRRLYEARDLVRATAAGAATGGRSGTVNISDNAVSKVEDQLNAITGKAAGLQKEIRQNEKTYLLDANGLVHTLTTRRAIPAIPPGGARDPYVNLRRFAGIFHAAPGAHGAPAPHAPDMSDPEHLFGVTDYPPPAAPGATPAALPVAGFPPIPRPTHTPSAFEHHIVTDFNAEHLGEMVHEIKKEYYDRFKPHRKLKAEELHMFLERGELFRQGNTNRQHATYRAMLTVRRKQNHIANRSLYIGTNQETAEYLGGTTLGMRWLNRGIKWLKTKVAPESMYTAQEVINRASIDKTDKNLGAFLEMPADITREEFRKLCHLNGLNKDTIAKYVLKLRKAMEKIQMDNPKFNIELYDKHGALLEDLVVTMQTILAEYEEDEIIRETANTGGDSDKDLFDKNLVEVMRAKANSRRERDDKILEEIAAPNPDWQRWFKRSGLKRDFDEDYKAAREQMKEKKMTSGEKIEFLKGQNLAAVAGTLGRAYAAAETVAVAKKGLTNVAGGVGKLLRKIFRGRKK